MKKLFLIGVFHLALWVSAFAQTSANVVVEDFEDGDTQNKLSGYWYSFNDNSSGGKSHLKQATLEQGFVKSGGHESPGMLQLDLMLDKGSYQWSPYFAIATSLDKTSFLNPSQF